MLLLFAFYLKFELCTKKIISKFYYLTILNGPLINCLFFFELLVCKRQSAGIHFDQNG